MGSIQSLISLQPVLFLILILVFLIQLSYYLFFYRRPLAQINKEKKGKISFSDSEPGISVIIYANNDSEQLNKHLGAFLDQDYPKFEVIVVNDGSTDETEDVLSIYEGKYDNLYHTFLADGARNLSRRKLSLTLGIKAAKYDIVALSNANCSPQSNQWLRLIARNFTEKTDIVLGYTSFEKRKGIGERFVAFDLLLRSIRIFGYTIAVKPFIGEGTNLAYRKVRFFEKKGFSKFMHLQMGDDDLFINQIATESNTRVELSEGAFMNASFDSNKAGWRQLKRNGAFTSQFYNSASKLFFGFESTTRYLFYIIAVLILLAGTSNIALASATAALVVIRCLLLSLFWFITGKKMNTRRFFFTAPIFDLFTPISNLFFKIENFFNKKRNYTWRL